MVSKVNLKTLVFYGACFDVLCTSILQSVDSHHSASTQCENPLDGENLLGGSLPVVGSIGYLDTVSTRSKENILFRHDPNP